MSYCQHEEWRGKLCASFHISMSITLVSLVSVTEAARRLLPHPDQVQVFLQKLDEVVQEELQLEAEAAKFPFGKYKGQTVKHVAMEDLSYIEFLLKQDWFAKFEDLLPLCRQYTRMQ